MKHAPQRDLTSGNITGTLLRFAFPLMIGNLLQQFYNIADTWIVGHFLGSGALAAVGSAYTLMVFLTSILLGLCMGSGAAFAIHYGERNFEKLGCSRAISFSFISLITLLLNGIVFWQIDRIIRILQVPAEITGLMKDYLWIIFWGIAATFLYNYFANLLRALGNSVAPLLFLGISAVLNIILDLVFVVVLDWGVKGAAGATVLAQYVSGIGILLYTFIRFPELRLGRRHMRWDVQLIREILGLSSMTCIQQSVMNFGILMVQGLVNSFGTVVMAAFAAAVKIDTFAYMPVQDFGNAFSTFVAQNFGAGKKKRIQSGIKSAVITVFLFCMVISILVCEFAKPLMCIFVAPQETEIIETGVGYLTIEASCYIGIGILFLLYGFYRAVKRAEMSVVLTVISLGTRVVLAYTLSAVPVIGVNGIWIAVPIGWLLADITGVVYYTKGQKNYLDAIGQQDKNI